MQLFEHERQAQGLPGGMAAMDSDYSANDNQINRDAARHWIMRQQALQQTPDDWTEQYRPKPQQPPGLHSWDDGSGMRYEMGGQDITNDLGEQSLRSQWGDNPMSMDDLAQARLVAARKAAAQNVLNRMTGNVPASMDEIMPLMQDRRFQQLDTDTASQLVGQTYGRSLDDYVGAQQYQNAYGQPLTWAQIAAMQGQAKRQSGELTRFNAISSALGTRGEMGKIASSTYDKAKGGVEFKDEDNATRFVPMTPEQHAEIQALFNRTLFPGYGVPRREVPTSSFQPPQEDPSEARRRRFEELSGLDSYGGP